MTFNRREFLGLAGTASAAISAGALAMTSAPASTQEASRFKWLLFDAFPIFDTRPVKALAESMFPGAGLSDAWRDRQFEYAWLRVATRHYANFWQVTREALIYSVALLKLNASSSQIESLMQAYLSLKAWPDVVPALKALKKQGLRFAFLSNFSPHMLEANIRSANLDGVFEQVLSSDQVQTFKPDPRAYRLGLDALKASREDVLFVAFGGWDAVGAKLFGYPTFWFNPQRLPPEQIGPLADGVGVNAIDLLRFVAQGRAVDS